jgi:E3 ubiquitin-protein ligase SHPRH
MLAILFPHMYEDVEYLLPPENSAMDNDYSDDNFRKNTASVSVENAIAGPSRLPYN